MEGLGIATPFSLRLPLLQQALGFASFKLNFRFIGLSLEGFRVMNSTPCDYRFAAYAASQRTAEREVSACSIPYGQGERRGVKRL